MLLVSRMVISMPRPRVTSQMTTTQVAKQLGMGESQLLSWIKGGVLPLPSFIDNNGVRYFDQEWLRKATEVLERKGVTDKVSGGKQKDLRGQVFQGVKADNNVKGLFVF